jgi:hypothetical protein
MKIMELLLWYYLQARFHGTGGPRETVRRRSTGILFRGWSGNGPCCCGGGGGERKIPLCSEVGRDGVPGGPRSRAVGKLQLCVPCHCRRISPDGEGEGAARDTTLTFAFL